LSKLPIIFPADLGTDTITYVERGGVVGLLLLVFVMLVTKRLVLGWQYDEIKEDRDRYREMALKLLQTGETTASTAEEIVRLLKKIQ